MLWTNTKNYSTPTKRYKTLISSTHSVYRLINSTYEVKEFVSRLSRLMCQIFNARYCLVILVDPSKQYSVLKCLCSERKKYVLDKKTKITNPLERKMLKKLVMVDRERCIGKPLVADDVIGLMIIQRSHMAVPFDEYDKDMFTAVIEQCIIGIKNLQLYEDQQKLLLGSIKSMVTFLDTRVPREYTHSPYFSKLVGAMGIEMHLDDKQVQSLRFACLLHDAGKIDIPVEILTKKTKLTPHEYNIIKNHAVKGAQMLRPVQVLKPVIPIIMHHHERYNGTGYPSRLKKGQIPLGARILAVADAFEAMVYGRPYRERKDVAGAIREIRSKSGSQFDPKIVEVFLKVIRKFDTSKYA